MEGCCKLGGGRFVAGWWARALGGEGPCKVRGPAEIDDPLAAECVEASCRIVKYEHVTSEMPGQRVKSCQPR